MINLPIYDVLDDIKLKLKNDNKLILQAPPGAGKSTVVPISLLNESWLQNKLIIMLEPRRVAVRMVATQMAKLLNEKVGESIGYQVKMDSCKSSKTKVLVVTEAILVRMLQSDQSLSNVAMIIFDEFHERSIHTDLSLALTLQVQELLRDDLKLLIMSATLNSAAIVNLIGDLSVVTSKGRVFEVEDIYLKENIKQPDFKTINSILYDSVDSAIKNDDGDILVFLAGVKEIKNLEKLLQQNLKNSDILILPLYSALLKKEQDRAILPNTKRKIILSTNIAQTSLTIEGVRVVIDSGLEKLSRYNYLNGMDHLELTFISKDSAIQRGGRAGRLSNGKCYKLWHQKKILNPTTKPEILRTDLSSLILDLALWGVEDMSELKWLDIPENSIINDTKEILKELQMLDDDFMITDFGKDSLALGLHPRYSYMILKASDMGYGYEACLLASMLSSQDIFTNSYKSSDIKDRFNHLVNKDLDSSYINKYRAKEILTQGEFFYTKLKKIKKLSKNIKPVLPNMIAIFVLFAYPDRLAKQRVKDDNRYKLSNSKGAKIDIEDTLFNEQFLVVPNLNANNKDSYINQAIAITLEDIESYFTHLIKTEQSIKYNKQKKKFDIKEHTKFLNLELYSQASKNSENQDFKKLLIELIQKEGLELLSWSKKAKSLKDKINFLNLHYKKETFPDFSDESLLNNLEEWLEPYLNGVDDIVKLEKLDIYTILLSQISWDKQQLIGQLLPKSIKVPSGSSIDIDYSILETPILSVKIQEIFGMMKTPKILNNSIALQVHLLSPAFRPIAITYDLKSFWENSYDEVRKELRGKYKRHYWPENPYEAIATNKTKKNMDRISK
ncbi:MAG: ATP-dependent helicase HrpB [Campylobacterota bacterium]|nr:ATP-dependent helicase HrpB [Campylobacterota bacterium]